MPASIMVNLLRKRIAELESHLECAEQLIELLVEDRGTVYTIEPTPNVSVDGTGAGPESVPLASELKPDTEKTAYLHNHILPSELAMMNFSQRAAECRALTQTLNKSVVNS